MPYQWAAPSDRACSALQECQRCCWAAAKCLHISHTHLHPCTAVGLSKKAMSEAAKDMLEWLEDSKSHGFPVSFFQPGLYGNEQGTGHQEVNMSGYDTLVSAGLARTDRRQDPVVSCTVSALRASVLLLQAARQRGPELLQHRPDFGCD